MGRAGFFVNIAAVVLIIFFDIMFCFRTYPSPPRPFGPTSLSVLFVAQVAQPSLLANDFSSHSIRVPNHRLHDELQQRNSCRSSDSDDSVVVLTRGEEICGAEADSSV